MVMEVDQQTTSLKRILLLISGLVVLFCLYQLGSAIYISQTTGILKVSASDPNATITLRRSGYKTVNVGVGQARVHLSPSPYTLIISSGRNQFSKPVQVFKKQVVTVKVGSLSAGQAQTSQANSAANSLIKLLPFSGPNNEYVVNYSYQFTSGSAQPVINIITATAKGKQDALAWISGLGFNPSAMNIQYSAPGGE
jgi:hypothetical protein